MRKSDLKLNIKPKDIAINSLITAGLYGFEEELDLYFGGTWDARFSKLSSRLKREIKDWMYDYDVKITKVK
jgi:hypothetical protein